MLIAVAIGLALPRVLDSDALRHEIEARLSAALNRTVTIERIEVDADEAAATLHGVSIADPEALGGGALLEARSLRMHVGLDALRHGAIEGDVEASGVVLRVVRAGGTTNLHGLGRPRSESTRKPVPMDLAVSLQDARVELVDQDTGQAATLAGVSVRAVVGAEAEQRRAGIDVGIGEVVFDDLRLRDVALRGRFEPDALAVTRLSASWGQHARIEGSGRVMLSAQGKPTRWEAKLAVAEAEIDDDLAPVAVRLFPALASWQQAVADAPETRWGRMSVSGSVSGVGIAWPAMRPSLVGEGSVTLLDVRIPAETLVARIARIAGHEGGPLVLSRASATVSLADQWVTLQRVTSEGELSVPPISGRVALDGRLDLNVDLMPLVEAYGGGVYARLRGVTSSIPVRVAGTVDDPEIKAPAATSIAKGLLGGLRHRVVGQQ